MAQTFDPIRVLRSFSLNLLREFILRHKGTPPSHGASVKRRNCGPLYEAWQSIPDDERAHMQLVLQKIHTLSQEHGMTALLEEIQSQHPERIGEFDRFEHRNDQIVWAWLNLPEAFSQAEFLARAESALTGRYWKRSTVSVPPNLQIDLARIDALQNELRHIYSAQLRGRHCCIEHHQRQSGVDYFCAYLDNWPDQVMEFQEDGHIEALSGRYAFSNVFSLDRQQGTLDVAARGGREIHLHLKEAFCRAILAQPVNAPFPARAIRRQVKEEIASMLTDEALVAAYHQHGSVRLAAESLSKQTNTEISKDKVHRALKRSGIDVKSPDRHNSDSLRRTVAALRQPENSFKLNRCR